MKASYEVLTVMQSWTQRGPTPDKLLSKHKSYDAAKKAFENACGKRVLVEVWNGRRTTIDAAII